MRSYFDMTGEITLRGLVLPIGGLKEKTLAAQRAGVKTVIIPKLNEKDLPDVPAEVKEKLEFVGKSWVDRDPLVVTIKVLTGRRKDEVLAGALEKSDRPQ